MEHWSFLDLIVQMYCQGSVTLKYSKSDELFLYILGFCPKSKTLKKTKKEKKWQTCVKMELY